MCAQCKCDYIERYGHVCKICKHIFYGKHSVQWVHLLEIIAVEQCQMLRILTFSFLEILNSIFYLTDEELDHLNLNKANAELLKLYVNYVMKYGFNVEQKLLNIYKKNQS